MFSSGGETKVIPFVAARARIAVLHMLECVKRLPCRRRERLGSEKCVRFVTPSLCDLQIAPGGKISKEKILRIQLFYKVLKETLEKWTQIPLLS